MGKNVVIGTTDFRGEQKLFAIKTPDRRRHLYVIGQTGVGKSTLLENMAVQDAATGNGFCLLDPHGQLATAILDRMPSHCANRVIYFDPSDAWPISLNVFQSGDPSYQDLIASRLVSLFKSIWGESLVGPRSEDLLRAAAFALVGVQGATLLWIPRLLVDDEFRNNFIVPQITNPVVQKFWLEEYNNYTHAFQQEVIAPIQNKLRSFLSVRMVRNVVAQPQRKVSMSHVMDNGQILICNLQKGIIGEDNASLLASLIAEEFYLSSLARITIPEQERRDFNFYVDEVQTIARSSAFASMLSECRKFRVSLILAHQYLDQLPQETTQAIFGNVGSIVAFRLGAKDSKFIEQEFAGIVNAQDVERLPAHRAYIRLSIDGTTSLPFSMATLPPPSSQQSNRENIIKTSRERFGRRKDFVEGKISQWLAREGT